MIGIMLAGGHATRLPFKPLLPMKDGQIMAMSARSAMLGNGCSYVVSVINEHDTALRVYMTSCGPVAFDRHEGVTSAILAGVNRAIQLAPANQDDLFAIFCCDNLYPREQYYGQRGAVLRYVEPRRGFDLDGFHLESGEYVRRGDKRSLNPTRMTGSYLALTTPWIVNYEDVKALFTCCDLIDWLNLIKLPPIMRDSRGWDDLGTREAYQAYWNNP